jgi:predicted ester cyclase
MMSAQDDLLATRRLLEQGFGGGDTSVVAALVAPDFVERQNGAQGFGPEAVKAIIRGLHDSLTDMHFEIEDVVAVGDDVWVRSRVLGVSTRPIMGSPPTGKSVEIDVIDVIRCRDGKMVEHWGVADRLGMLQQLGLTPQRGERPAA